MANRVYKIPRDTASKSTFLTSVLEMQDVDQVIPVPFVAREDVAQVLYDFFCSNPIFQTTWPPRLCYDVLLAANGMDMPSLLELCVEEIAARWISSKIQEIRSTWGFEDNLTKKEKGAIQKENALLEILDVDTTKRKACETIWAWPPEMLFLILSKLPTRELARVRGVCAEVYDSIHSMPGRGDLAVSAEKIQKTNVPFVERHCLLQIQNKQQLESLQSLQNLRYLEIKPANDIGAEGAAALSCLQNLQHLEIGYNNNIGAQGAAALSCLKNLKKLVIGLNNNIGPDGAAALSCLKNLEELVIGYNNNIGAEGAAALSCLKNLKKLGIGYNDIGPGGAAALSCLQNLQHLEIGYNDIGANGATALSCLQNLQHLEIGPSNDIGAEGAAALSCLQNLQHLEIGYNNIGPDGAKALSRLQNLQHLEIGPNNDIGAEGAAALARLKNLRYLEIQRRANFLGVYEEKGLQLLLPHTKIVVY